ncbi:hypothetical protein DAE33_24715, partial [Salmonella enterica]|nr:hypothetical protein [Salmonella enterica]EDI1355948.1 hypothetical protein [Salmonella enterica]
MLNLKSILSLALSSCSLLPLCIQAKIPESRMINYEHKISLTNEQKINLEKLANSIHAESFKKLYSSDGWGKYGKFSDL